MSAPVAAAVIWVFLATCTAFLPMRFQFVPGIALLIAAPAVIIVRGVLIGGLVLSLFSSLRALPDIATR